jgi:uncharacterized protein (DUF302 family)
MISSSLSGSSFGPLIPTLLRPIGLVIIQCVVAAKESMMQDESTLIHCEHVSARPFDAVVTAFRAAVGAGDGDAFRKAVEAATGPDDFETRMHASEGPSGFMLFLEADHGAWMARVGLQARAKLYIIGNPLIARTMIEHDIGVGLNVPVRVLIYEEPRTGTCRLAYDLPSSLMERLKNERVTAAAKRLDQKLSALAEAATGVSA